ncbi:NACHT domain-containing protein [Lentzea sp. JNUCC 0626]|uniref:NACHT domain-containing protein n=1 Tax=Lentzea sp. JNUCC 0626 TaxID=3367513 RepID=UPI00374A0A27
MAPRTKVITAGLVVTAAVLLVLAFNSLEENDAYSSIAAALVAIGTAFAGVVLHLSRDGRPQPADQEADALALELLAQWEPEIRHRRERFGSQSLIPLGWTGTDIGPVRLHTAGRLEGNPDSAATALADAFDQLPSRRLVMIGEPGSGKTFLGILLTAGLLRRRTQGSPVPVFLSLSSWDPVADPLDDWLIRTLATTYYNGRQQAVRALLLSRLIVPILDGLDELPDHARRRAVNRLNDVLDGDRPLVLTCRITEYEDLITGGAPTLLRAPVVRINPVTTQDVIARLRPWPTVAKHVKAAPDGPIATALSTPLMLSLFAAAYKDRTPDDLTRFTNRHAVEDHLVDLMVTTLYPDEKHRRWLTYLAEVLHRNDDHEFRWWQLARRTLSPWIAPVLGLLVGVPVFAVMFWTASKDLEDIYSRDLSVYLLANPQLIATIFGVAVTSLWLASSGREPGPVSSTPGLRGLGRGVAAGAALVLVPGVPFLLMGTKVFEQDLDSRSPFMTYAGALVALALVSGIGVGLHELLAARTSRAGKASPEEFLRQDRRSTFTSAAVTGVVVGALTVITCSVGAALGAHFGRRIASTDTIPALVTFELPPMHELVPWSLSGANTARLIANSALFVVLFAVAVLATRAWTRFLVARTVLALGGRLPWRLMHYLADARERGLLRVSGGSYQFWHIRLQERLVMNADRTTSRRSVPRVVTAGLTATALVAAVTVVWVTRPEPCQSTGWSTVDERMVRVSLRGATGCFAALTDDEWQLLHKSPGDDEVLDRIGRHPRLPGRLSSEVWLMVLGDLAHHDGARWQETLKGIAAAQDIHVVQDEFDRPLVVGFTQSDSMRDSSPDLDVVTRHYVSLKNKEDDATTVNGPYEIGAVVTLDSAGLTFFNNGESASMWSIVGLANADLRTHMTAVAESARQASLFFHNSLPPARLAEEDLADGVSDQECATLQQLHADTAVMFDLGELEPTTDLMTRLSACTKPYMTVVIDQRHVELATTRFDRFPFKNLLNMMYVEDRSATIVPDCATKVASPGAIAACTAALVAAGNARVYLKPIHLRE